MSRDAAPPSVWPAPLPLVLVSACLLGSPVRYNAIHKRCDSEVLARWLAQGRVVPVCPEVSGGLPVPRPPAEISLGAGGAKVLLGQARVIDRQGQDVSDAFISGARHVLVQAQSQDIRVAVLKEGSPSCGSGYIYDGSFTGQRMVERGVTAALLESAGIRVFSEAQFVEANDLLLRLEAGEAA
ncbi:purine-nucleoside phosphorylase [Rhodoferax fermentans]|uniref:Purine-nucleoside phosphorylase n=1 Tax=Rhodoferax fermentans TaxID=28066 RepID=A0A1T1ARL2_RHOFE|nr:purine-nucleoside phosphorylase [Rhodoferax fermentans]